MDRITQVSIFLGIVCTVIMGISRRDGDFVLKLLNMLLYLAFMTGGPMHPHGEEVLKQMPQEIRSLLSKFDLESRTIIYAVCPACDCTYEPEFPNDSDSPTYPSNCTNIPHPEADMCGERLLQSVVVDDDDDAEPRTTEVKTTKKPIKPFVYHHFHDYLANLLSRKDLELMMDNSCDELMETVDKPPDFARDVWDAEFVRTFKGPKSRRLFVDRGSEGRYLFALNIDFFNVEGMRIRGASTSCGLISAVCLNLLPEIRYKPENMYVGGIIPGPHEPRLTRINHYIRPLISHFCESWERGVRYDRTALHPNGRLTHSALAAAVMDLKAARGTTGLGQNNHECHCSVCQCRGKETLGSTDHGNWLPRDCAELRDQAEKWRSASSLKEQDEIFRKYGTRYSEFWRLEYWDPTRQIVVDCMHNTLEGNAQDHFRQILALTKESAESKPEPPPAFDYKFAKIDSKEPPFPDDMTEKEAKQVGQIHLLLTAPLAGVDDTGVIVDHALLDNSITLLDHRLAGKNMKALVFVCSDLKLVPSKPDLRSGTLVSNPRYYKKDWIQCLVEWVCIFFDLFIHITDLYSSVNSNHTPLRVDMYQNSPPPNLCDEFMMSPRIQLCQLGLILFPTTTAKRPLVF